MIDHEHTDDIVCPYCGDAHEPDGDDYSETAYQTECSECEREFTVSCSMIYSFSTAPYGPEEKARDAEYRTRIAEMRAPALKQHAEDDAFAASFTPGMRVRVKDSHRRCAGWTGIVLNEERAPCCVRVEANGVRNSFPARHLEKL